MLIGKSFVCYSKIDRDPVSVLLEIKGRPDTLLFESGAIAELCKYESILNCAHKKASSRCFILAQDGNFYDAQNAWRPQYFASTFALGILTKDF